MYALQAYVGVVMFQGCPQSALAWRCGTLLTKTNKQTKNNNNNKNNAQCVMRAGAVLISCNFSSLEVPLEKMSLKSPKTLFVNDEWVQFRVWSKYRSTFILRTTLCSMLKLILVVYTS